MKLHAAMIVALLSGCGAGTEIGNGFKPSGGDGDPDSKSAKAAEDSHGGTESMNLPTDDDGDVGGDAVNVDFTFPVDLLGAGCGSPFGEAIEGRVRLASTDATGTELNVLEASYVAQQQRWSLVDKNDRVVRFIAPVAGSLTAEVTTTTPDDKVVSDTYTCSNRTSTDGVTVSDLTGTFRKVEVTLSEGDAVDVVTWYLDVGATTKLVRVTIKDAAHESNPTIVLDATEAAKEP